MKIFMSGEISLDEENYEKFRLIQNEIEQKIKELLSNNDYGDAIRGLSIIPTIFSEKFYKTLPYPERTRYSPKTKETDMRLKIDYNKFVQADDKGKERLFIQNVIDCIRILKKKVKKGFAGEKLEQDILNLFGYKYEDLEKA